MPDVESKTWIRDLSAGRLVDSTFAVLRKDLRRARTGAPFLSLELGDRTGRVRAVCFDDVPLLDGRFAQGDTVRVLGAVEEYRGRVQIVVRSVERVEAGDPLVYVPGARRDTEDLEGFLEFLIGEIHDSTLRSLVEGVYADARFRPLVRQAPVTVDGHHAYAGGAIQHTVAVASICRETCQLHPRLDESVVGGRRAHLLRRSGRRLPARRRAAARRGGAPARRPAAVAAPGRARGAPAADAARAPAAARALHLGRPAEDAGGRGADARHRARRGRRRCAGGRSARIGFGACSDSRCSSSTWRSEPSPRTPTGSSRAAPRPRARTSIWCSRPSSRSPATRPRTCCSAPRSSPPAGARWSRWPGASTCRCWSGRRGSTATACTTPPSCSRAARSGPATTSSTCPTTASSTRSARSRRAGTGSRFEAGGALCAVTVCEDLWLSNGPAGRAARGGATVILNISSSPYHVGKALVARGDAAHPGPRRAVDHRLLQPRRRPGRAGVRRPVGGRRRRRRRRGPGGGLRGGGAGLRGRPGRRGLRPPARHAAAARQGAPAARAAS